MSILESAAKVSNTIEVGGSALSLIGSAKALVTKKNPPKGISGFLFDIPETENVQHSAQITDHFTEDNYAIQDHVAFDPIRITLVGRVGNLVYTKLAALEFAQQVLDRLQPFGLISPSKDLAARRAISEANRLASAVNATINAGKNLYSVLSGEPALNPQQSAFKVFEQYFFGRSILTVETPWKTYDNMIIENWSADQDASTIHESSFTLTFKQLRVVSTKTNVGQLVGRVTQQKAPVVNSGTQQGKSIGATGVDFIFGGK